MVTEVKPTILKAKADIDQTNLSFPYFGVIGIGIQAGHDEIQTYARNYLQSAADCIDRLSTSLSGIAATWRNAEDKSQVKHQ